MYKNYIKRLLDIIVSIISLPFVLLVIFFVGPLIYLEDRGCIFYLAQRRGLNGKIFRMYKLRSMVINAPDFRNEDNSTYNSPDDPRVTKIGKFIRKTSLDEVPQFINVLKGDMSIIGPRPVTIDRPLDTFDEKRKIRLTVRPGITGYSQAYFRNSISSEEKLEKDAEYARHVTFIGDMKILAMTVKSVFLRKNIYNKQ
jgi:lipopolysaccharide/colanic/teichoic acid biosynthesis glycosyltransferase